MFSAVMRRVVAWMLASAALLGTAHAEQFWYGADDPRQTPQATAAAACFAGGQQVLAAQQAGSSLKHRVQIITTQTVEPDAEVLCKATIQRKQLNVWLTVLAEQPYSAYRSGEPCPIVGLGDGNGQCCSKCDRGCSAGGGGAGSNNGSNPIDGSSGNKFQPQTDYAGAGWMPLNWSRAYNHLSFERGPLGTNWKHGYERRIAVTAFSAGSNQVVPTAVKLYRADGRRYNINASGSTWVGAEADIDYRLERVVDAEAGTTGWRLRTPDNEIESYDAQGLLTTVSRIDGAKLTLAYDSANNYRLAGITDDFGRALTLGYDAQGRINSVAIPGGRSIAYGYDSANNLATASYPEGAGSVTRSYLYNEAVHVGASFPNALTGIVDEAGKRYATFKYDAQQRAVLSTHAGGADSNSFTYNADGSATVVDALGTSRNFGYSNVLGRRVVTGVSQPCAACGGSVAQSLTHDAQGNATSATDYNGNKSCRAFDTTRNLATAEVEGLAGAAVCSAVTPVGVALPAGTRKTQTQWHPDWRVPTRRAEPKKITTWVYHGQPDPFNGNALASCAPAEGLLANGLPIAVVCKRVEQSTTDASGAAGFTASVGNGVVGNTTPASRTWTHTYNRYGQRLTTDGPRTDLSDTQAYAYHAASTANVRIGDLQQITNALGQVTQYTQYNAHGQVLAMLDANNIVTTQTYDERQRLKTRTAAAGTASARTTSYNYDPRGVLQQVNFPAGTVSNAAGSGGAAVGRSHVYTYDDAQRLTGITSASGEQLLFELDGLGNVKREELRNSTALGGSASLLRREFDALGRLFREIRIINGADQTTQMGYDAQGNLRTVQRPAEPGYGETNAPTETRLYTALNQLRRIEDGLYGSTQPSVIAPDARDQPASVQAANGATTTYQRDGFDQVLVEQSPDRGSTSFSFDAAGNLRSQLDARGVTATHSYDALNRLTATAYTQAGATSSEDRSYTWDSNPGGPIACANGVGRLCRISDASGVTHQAYSVFGNLSQQRTVEIGIDRSLLFGHDGEDRPSALTTAGGKALATVRDNEGRAQRVLGIVGGVSTQIVKATIYRGDGQSDTTTLGNNVVLDRNFDSSGAPVGLAETGLSPGGGGNDGEVPTAPEWALILLAAILLWQMTRPRQVGRSLHSVWPIVALILLAATTQAMADEALQLDTRGNIKSRTVDGRASVYRYDRIDRLNNETGVLSQSIGMDANANRTSDGLASYTVQANGNRITQRSGVTLTYDAAGNLLSDTTRLNGTTVNRSFTYTLSGSLKTVSIGGALRATYTYNAQNQRTRKVLASPSAGSPATTLYRYDTQGHLIEEIAGSSASASGVSVSAGQSLVTYVWKDDVPSAVIHAPNSPCNPGNPNERIVYLHTDHLDSPRKASDSAGRVVWSWESDAFGSTAALDDSGGDGNKTPINLRFPGQYLDAESGLNYNWHRYYDPGSGRYTQFDPIGLDGGPNSYLYVDGKPLNWRDVGGQIPSAGDSSIYPPTHNCTCMTKCLRANHNEVWEACAFPSGTLGRITKIPGAGVPITYLCKKLVTYRVCEMACSDFCAGKAECPPAYRD